MANEIQVNYASGNVLYAAIRRAGGDVWHPSQQGFEAWGTDGRDADDYDIQLADKSGSRYVGDFDSNVPAGRYAVQVFVQGGANPSDADLLVGGCEIVWTGAGVLTTDKILANRAMQDKSTGAIDYYDDDGQTVILTHTANDGELSIERGIG